MKKIKISILPYLLLTLYCVSNAGPDWYWQNPIPQGYNLYDIHVFDMNHAVAVGENGVIITTSDCGCFWEVQYNAGGVSASLHDVSFPDRNNGWAVGDDGTIINSHNGGLSWMPQEINTDVDLSSVCFIDSLTGWTSGFDSVLATPVLLETV